MPFSKLQTCLLCHDVQTDSVCSGCLTDLRELFSDADNCCPKCAQFCVGGAVCGHCQKHPPPYAHLWACAEYAAPLPALLHAWKHSGQRGLSAVFVRMMRENPPPWLHDTAFDAVLAMPLARSRRMARGFNQCDTLAQEITRRYKIPTMPHDSVFRVPKPPQSTLDAAARTKNIENVFRVRTDVKNRKVLIIDDVATTAATISELARTLLQSGACAVSAFVVARNK